MLFSFLLNFICFIFFFFFSSRRRHTRSKRDWSSDVCSDLVVHASGVVSVVTAGVLVARYGSRTGRLQGTQLHGFWNLLACVLNAILFLMIGIAVPAHRLVPLAGLALGAYSIMFAARAIPVYGLLG